MAFADPIVSWLQPYADKYGMHHLPTHVPTLLRSTLFWFALQVLSSQLSPKLFPKTFAKLNRKTKISWDIHVVSFVHAAVVTPLAASIWWKTRQPNALGIKAHPLAVDRLYGYDWETAQVYAIAQGYFVWDSIISILYEGPGFIAHGIVALTAFTLVYHPIFMYDGMGFLMWELSTPFLNIHWFLDKLGKTGSTAQLINAFFLLTSYVGARLTFGVYNSISFFKFVVAPARPHHPAIPGHLKAFYLVGNVILNSLNFFWFRAMVRAVQKRFTVKPDPAGKVDPKKVANGKQQVKVGVQGNDDEEFWQEAGATKKSN
ncbi:DUF887-domain-containing protein [Testicularia cyperi]|uniref:DUF887-domain-containing protein n=1 Tax=Testicularia cyperi TaxID=1882483 RepID=A0A317XXE8_9BASI|nr:DUF887-domain-containing protein [Testicularia cyperi]